MYSDEYVDSIVADPVNGAIEICRNIFAQVEGTREWSEDDLLAISEAYAFLIELCDAKLLPIQLKAYEVQGDLNADCKAMMNALSAIEKSCVANASKHRVDTLRTRFRSALGAGFFYEFSQGDLDRVQQLVNELRTRVAESTHFEDDHKRRLLARLEKLQTEIHKKVSDLDRFWGLIGDAGVVLGKMGKDAKPIVDRVKEIADIVWKTQSRSEELPSGTTLPLLEDKSSDKGPVEE